MVPPDFEDTITSVVAGSQSASSSRMRTGESESSVLKETRFERTVSDLLYFVMVMGACVEPPWPMRTTVLMPLSTTLSAKRWTFSRSHCGFIPKSTHPIKFSAHSRAPSEKS